MPATSRPAFDEAFPEQAPEARPRFEILEGGGESVDIVRPELHIVEVYAEPSSETEREAVDYEDEAEEADTARFGRAATGAGGMIGNYVENPAKRPVRDRRHTETPETKKSKDKNTRNRDDEFKGGSGGQWWREQVKKAKESHDDTCNCIYCLSPDI